VASGLLAEMAGRRVR